MWKITWASCICIMFRMQSSQLHYNTATEVPYQSTSVVNMYLTCRWERGTLPQRAPWFHRPPSLELCQRLTWRTEAMSTMRMRDLRKTLSLYMLPSRVLSSFSSTAVSTFTGLARPRRRSEWLRSCGVCSSTNMPAATLLGSVSCSFFVSSSARNLSTSPCSPISFWSYPKVFSLISNFTSIIPLVSVAEKQFFRLLRTVIQRLSISSCTCKSLALLGNLSPLDLSSWFSWLCATASGSAQTGPFGKLPLHGCRWHWSHSGERPALSGCPWEPILDRCSSITVGPFGTNLWTKGFPSLPGFIAFEDIRGTVFFLGHLCVPLQGQQRLLDSFQPRLHILHGEEKTCLEMVG